MVVLNGLHMVEHRPRRTDITDMDPIHQSNGYPSDGVMNSYIEQLKSAVVIDKKNTEKINPRENCSIPLDQQINELMRSLPPRELNRPWLMEEFVARLDGRYKTNPHAMRVGEALRKLGWVRRRDWSTAGGGRRYWYATDSTKP